MDESLHKQAVRLRERGWSYNIISNRLGVAKSTLSHWLRDVPYVPNSSVRKRIHEGPSKSSVVRHKKRMDSIRRMEEVAAKEVGVLSKRDLLMLGVGLYIGEGAKLYENTQVINSDPEVVKLIMRWFLEVCDIPIKHFSIAVHIYPDVDEVVARIYWSKVTGIPQSQFTKVQIDRRENKTLKRRRKLPYGTVHVSVRACGRSEFGVILHRKIMGWIKAVYNQSNKQNMRV